MVALRSRGRRPICCAPRVTCPPDYLPFLGRPPFLPHWESLFLYLRVEAFPPFSPMHRGHTILVRKCCVQNVSLATHKFYRKTYMVKPPGGFFLPLPPCFPQSDSCALCLAAVARPPPDAMHRGQTKLVLKCLGQDGIRDFTAKPSWSDTSCRNPACSAE